MSNKKTQDNLSRLKTVILKGPVLSNSGYGVHARQVFDALASYENYDVYVQPTSWGNTSWVLNEKYNEDQIQNILQFSQKQKPKEGFDISYQVLLPNEWENIARFNVGITAGFEADIVKRSWIDHCNQMNKVIVPSEFSRKSFLKTCKNNKLNLKTEIKVFNEWYYSQFDNIKIEEDFLDEIKYEKNLLIIGQITSSHEKSDRKNMLKTIRVACKFIENKDIGIVLKINSGRHDYKSIENIKNVLKENIKSKFLKKIAIISGSLNIKELKSLYSNSKISCMLSGTRAEGWGLPFVEAASCGLPIIATNYSAYKEFLEEDFIKVDYKNENFNFDINFTDPDSSPQWANFKIESMLDKLNLFFLNIEKYQKIAKQRQKIIKQKYSKDNIIKEYIKFFEKNL